MKGYLNLNDYDIICLDFFDTIVHRNCQENEVKEMWAKKMHYHYPNIPASVFYKTRLQTESYLWENKGNNHEIQYEKVAYEIFFSLSNYELDTDKFSFYNLSLECDYQSEKSVLFTDEETLEVIKEQKKDGKEIIVLSDFYLPERILTRLCSDLKILYYIDGIYVSNDINLRKSDGSMYDYIKQSYANKKIVMIGDNRKSDFEIPKEKGIDAIHKKYSSSRKNKLDSELKKTWSNDLFSGYAYEFFYFIDNLYEEMIKMGGDVDLFFLSREGQLLKKLFDVYQKDKEIKINTHYFCVSRTSTYLASLKPINEETFDDFFYNIEKIYRSEKCSIYDFLKSLSFDSTQIEMIKDNFNYDISIPLVDLKNTVEYSELLRCHTFITLYEKVRVERREAFLDYYNSFIKADANSFLIVDVGWKGSIQDNIQAILGNQVKVKGYYYGISRHTRYGGYKKGIVFDRYPNKSKLYWYYENEHIWIEKLLTANHGSVVSYSNNNGQVFPVMMDDKVNQEIYDIVSMFQKKILELFQTVNDIFKFTYRSSSDFERVFGEIHFRNVMMIKKEEQKLKSKLYNLNDENWGVFSNYTDSQQVVRRTPIDKEQLFFKCSKKIVNYLSRVNMFQKINYLFVKVVYKLLLEKE